MATRKVEMHQPYQPFGTPVKRFVAAALLGLESL
jgi:hypothetical protein